MNREYNSKISSKNSKWLLKNLQNMTGDYFFATPCTVSNASIHGHYGQTDTLNTTPQVW